MALPAGFGAKGNFPDRRGEKNTAWKGGRLIDSDGYVTVLAPEGHPFARRSGRMLESRVVMERKIGRYLLPSEVVHHRDDNRQNNDPENLELFANNADHLAETLKGRVPKWTEQGLRNMREGVLRSASRRSAASRERKKIDDLQ